MKQVSVVRTLPGLLKLRLRHCVWMAGVYGYEKSRIGAGVEVDGEAQNGRRKQEQRAVYIDVVLG